MGCVFARLRRCFGLVVEGLRPAPRALLTHKTACPFPKARRFGAPRSAPKRRHSGYGCWHCAPAALLRLGRRRTTTGTLRLACAQNPNHPFPASTTFLIARLGSRCSTCAHRGRSCARRLGSRGCGQPLPMESSGSRSSRHCRRRSLERLIELQDYQVGG